MYQDELINKIVKIFGGNTKIIYDIWNASRSRRTYNETW